MGGICQGERATTGISIKNLDENVNIIDRGTKIGDTAMQMAQDSNPALYRQVVKAYKSNDLNKTSAEISETSSKIMGGLSKYVEQSGKNAHKAIGQAYMELGLGTPSISPYQAKVGARGEIRAESDKTTNVNLMTKALDDVQTKALKEGERLGYTDKALGAHVAAKTGQFVNTWKSFATSDKEFGANKPGEMMNQAKDTIVDGAKKSVESAGIVKSPFHPDHPDYKGKKDGK